MPSVFHGRVDHADELCRDFRVLVNPSKTEVLCTTVAEALAMGKMGAHSAGTPRTVLLRLSDVFVLRYEKKFAEKFAYAVRHEPPPLSNKERRRLSWAAATERFCDASLMPSS